MLCMLACRVLLTAPDMPSCLWLQVTLNRPASVLVAHVLSCAQCVCQLIHHFPRDIHWLAGAHSSNLTAEALRRYTSDQEAPPPQSSKDTSVNLPTGADRDGDDWHTTRSLSNLVFPSGGELSRDEQKQTQAAPERTPPPATGGDL